MANNTPSFPPPPVASPTITTKKVKLGSIPKAAGHRVLFYGPGGIGKTTLCCRLPGKTAFFDLDESLGRLYPQLDAEGLTKNVFPIAGISKWSDLRSALQQEGWDEITNIIIDTGTKAEELCVAHTLANVKNEKGTTVNSIEGYGYGKGYQHVYETFLPLLSDLDAHARKGRNVIIVAHDCTAPVPNPTGDDYIRYEPRLQNPTSGKASIRLRVKEWADHVLFYSYDVAVNKDGKGVGTGTRTIYTAELPSFMAKSRTTTETIPVSPGLDVWSLIFK